jgi:hypothetical protein
MRSIPGIVGRTCGALGRENVNIIAIAQGSSECTISFVVAKKDMKAALASIHQAFLLGSRLDCTIAEDENYYRHGEPAQTSHRPDQEQQKIVDLDSPNQERLKQSLSLDSEYPNVQGYR